MSSNQLIRAATTVFGLLLLSSNASSSSKLEIACEIIKSEVGDCGCAVRFLQETLGPEQGVALLNVWAAGAGYRGDPAKAFTQVYKQHSPEAVLKASSQFLNVRTEFEAECRPAGFIFFE